MRVEGSEHVPLVPDQVARKRGKQVEREHFYTNWYFVSVSAIKYACGALARIWKVITSSTEPYGSIISRNVHWYDPYRKMKWISCKYGPCNQERTPGHNSVPWKGSISTEAGIVISHSLKKSGQTIVRVQNLTLSDASIPSISQYAQVSKFEEVVRGGMRAIKLLDVLCHNDWVVTRSGQFWLKLKIVKAKSSVERSECEIKWGSGAKSGTEVVVESVGRQAGVSGERKFRQNPGKGLLPVKPTQTRFQKELILETYFQIKFNTFASLICSLIFLL